VLLNSLVRRNFSSKNGTQFAKVLIANRGEIACRIISTCKKLGIPTVAVYSTADSRASHVTMADEAICLGPPSSLESYLNIDKVCMAIEQTGAQAVAPGYGFLSENATFASRIQEMGVAFIGPPAESIKAMGDKITSKQIAEEAGVNTIPGYSGVVRDEEHAIELANEIGYPVMIKATSGGGGKGMRICYNDDDTREGFVLSTAEATQSFGDGRLFIERYIENPHHIEFQIVAAADSNGETTEVLVFPERECSIQRRNQKVLEESPSVLLTRETRKEMARQAELLAKAVGYTSAGTIEFLVEGGNSKTNLNGVQNFFFLEMNTRLQVEHPVTEMVTGVDLVEQMLHVSAKQHFNEYDLSSTILPESLLTAQLENTAEGVVPYKGWALEARVYAEDPLRNFLPSTGPLLKYEEPSTEAVSNAVGDDGEHNVAVRVDSGVRAGTNISMHYDPMISKLVTYAENPNKPNDLGARTKTIQAMVQALHRYVISGVQHNAIFIRHLLGDKSHSASEAFERGDTPTSFIDTHYPEGFQAIDLLRLNDTDVMSENIAAMAVSSAMISLLKEKGSVGNSDDVLVVLLGGFFGIPFEVKFDAGMATVTAINSTEKFTVSLSIDDVVHDPLSQSAISEFKLNGKIYVMQFHGESSDGTMTLQIDATGMLDVVIRSRREHELAAYMKEPPAIDTSLMLLSPMPGKLVGLAVEEGEHVEEGQELCTVEAMKMQNVLRSARKGVIDKVCISVGSSVKADEVIFKYRND